MARFSDKISNFEPNIQKKMKRFLIIALLILTTSTVGAQKVGLVLSGGGAKGLYHIGIIKALEQNGVPIDYVSGASMGAIVGAMYSAGWSPDRMWNFFLTDSVSTWLSGKIPDEYQYYYRKFSRTPEMVSVNINPDTTSWQAIQLPTNLISPYMIDLAMNEILAPASAGAGNNFDSLMVPFRCVVSNMNRRESVVCRNGSLPFAVRASMTIPLVFKPLVYQDSILLYDGGVLNNYPYQTLKEDFKPDIVIGGVCVGGRKNPSQNDIMGQIDMLMTDRTNYTLTDSIDITIRNPMRDIGTLDYNKAYIVMQRGYEDAMAQMPLIKERITRYVSQEEIKAKRDKFIAKTPRLIFDHIDIQGLSVKQTAYVKRQLGLHLHTHFTFAYFYEKYLHILSTGVFAGEFPKISFDPDRGYYSMVLKMKTQPSIRFALGGNISSNALSQAYLGFEYQRVSDNVATYGVSGQFGYFYSGIQVGARHDMFANFPFYIDWGYHYEDFSWDTGNATNYYANKDWRYKNQQESYFTTSIAVPVFGNSALRARISGGISTYEYFLGLHTSADIASKSFLKYGTISAEIETNSMNYPLYEDQGVKEVFIASYTYGQEDYQPGSLSDGVARSFNYPRGWFMLRYMREQYFKSNGWFTVGYLVDAVISNQPKFVNDLVSDIASPRFAPTPHTQSLFMREFTSDSYFGFGVMPVFNFLKNRTFYLKTYAFAFIPQEIVYKDGLWHKPTLENATQLTKFIFGGSLVYQTPIGPASFTVAKYTTGPKNWAFIFNFGYTIFGKRKF